MKVMEKVQKGYMKFKSESKRTEERKDGARDESEKE